MTAKAKSLGSSLYLHMHKSCEARLCTLQHESGLVITTKNLKCQTFPELNNLLVGFFTGVHSSVPDQILLEPEGLVAVCAPQVLLRRVDPFVIPQVRSV
jgi:hypothetical protein